jgi:hypothetical protein
MIKNKLNKMWFVELREFDSYWKNELEFRLEDNYNEFIINRNWKSICIVNWIVELYDK